MSTVVSVRIDDDKLRIIKKLGYKPGEFLAEALDSRLRLEKSKRSIEWFRKNRFIKTGMKGVDLIRSDRDGK